MVSSSGGRYVCRDAGDAYEEGAQARDQTRHRERRLDVVEDPLGAWQIDHAPADLGLPRVVVQLGLREVVFGEPIHEPTKRSPHFGTFWSTRRSKRPSKLTWTRFSPKMSC